MSRSFQKLQPWRLASHVRSPQRLAARDSERGHYCPALPSPTWSPRPVLLYARAPAVPWGWGRLPAEVQAWSSPSRGLAPHTPFPNQGHPVPVTWWEALGDCPAVHPGRSSPLLPCALTHLWTQPHLKHKKNEKAQTRSGTVQAPENRQASSRGGPVLAAHEGCGGGHLRQRPVSKAEDLPQSEAPAQWVRPPNVAMDTPAGPLMATGTLGPVSPAASTDGSWDHLDRAAARMCGRIPSCPRRAEGAPQLCPVQDAIHKAWLKNCLLAGVPQQRPHGVGAAACWPSRASQGQTRWAQSIST